MKIQARKRRSGVDGTAYAGGYRMFALKAELKDNPYRLESNREGWEAGWLDARDEYEAHAQRQFEEPAGR